MDAGKIRFLYQIPGTRNLKRLTENILAESIHLSVEEVTEIDDMLEHIPMSQVFGGSKVKNNIPPECLRKMFGCLHITDRR